MTDNTGEGDKKEHAQEQGAIRAQKYLQKKK